MSIAFPTENRVRVTHYAQSKYYELSSTIWGDTDHKNYSASLRAAGDDRLGIGVLGLPDAQGIVTSIITMDGAGGSGTRAELNAKITPIVRAALAQDLMIWLPRDVIGYCNKMGSNLPNQTYGTMNVAQFRQSPSGIVDFQTANVGDTAPFKYDGDRLLPKRMYNPHDAISNLSLLTRPQNLAQDLHDLGQLETSRLDASDASAQVTNVVGGGDLEQEPQEYAEHIPANARAIFLLVTDGARYNEVLLNDGARLHSDNALTAMYSLWSQFKQYNPEMSQAQRNYIQSQVHLSAKTTLKLLSDLAIHAGEFDDYTASLVFIYPLSS